MGDSKFGRKTSPGFADPDSPALPAHGSPTAAGSPMAPVAPIKIETRDTPVETDRESGDLLSPATPQPAVKIAERFVRPAGKAAAAIDPEAARIARARQTPLVEVEVVHERGRAPRSEPLRRCYEIWTQNTVYEVDSKMNCVAVRTPGSGQSKPDHPFLGARLVGGQLQGKEAIEMSYPLPRPGAFAVFESRKGNRRHFSRTSSVERVVLRLRIVTITDGASVPSWDDFIEDSQ